MEPSARNASPHGGVDGAVEKQFETLLLNRHQSLRTIRPGHPTKAEKGRNPTGRKGRKTIRNTAFKPAPIPPDHPTGTSDEG